ncbi:MAG: nucleotidyltransferase family protein [Hyphomonadaceae bacterium]|nr:nucleotidyltransferase family protein [Hyphomonadaceae bacterium]
MSDVTTAMVLAAGLGTRMRPLTNTRPKCLVTVNGKTLMDHMLDRLVGAGITRVIVNVHAFADLLEAHLRNRRDAEIVISDERDQLMETGGGVRKALHLLGDGPFVICNTDSIWEEPDGSAIKRLVDGFDASRMDARLMLADMTTCLGFDTPGDFTMTPPGTIALRGAALSAAWAYTGVQIVRPEIVAPEPIEPFSFKRIWERSIASGRLFGGALDGFWMHVGDPAARDAAEARLLQARAP